MLKQTLNLQWLNLTDVYLQSFEMLVFSLVGDFPPRHESETTIPKIITIHIELEERERV